MMKVSLILEAINRMTGPIGAAARSVERLGAVVGRTSRSVRTGMMGMYDATRDATAHFQKLAGPEGIGRASRSIDYLKNKMSGLTTGFSVLKYASAAVVVGLGEEFVRGVFHAGGEMQSMLVTLTKLEGGGARARQSLAWMQDFVFGAAGKFSMPDIMQAYKMSANFQMNPKSGSLATFANVASADNKGLLYVINAVKDAMEGTSTRPLANLGIKMKQGKGPDGQNSYLYGIGDRKGLTATSAKTPDAVLSTVLRIFDAKYSGLAAAQAKTVPGGIEQIKKLLYLFQANIATRKGGVFDWALPQINRFIATIRKMTADGSLDALEAKIAKVMTGAGDKIIKFVTATNWSAVGKDLKALGASIAVVGTGLKIISDIGGGGLSGMFNMMVVKNIIGVTAALTGLAPAIAGAATMMLGFDVAALPITLTIAAIGALIAIGWLLYTNWSTIGPKITAGWKWVVDTGKSIWNGLVGFFEGLWARIKSMVPDGSSLMPKLPSWLGGSPAAAATPRLAAGRHPPCPVHHAGSRCADRRARSGAP